MRRVFLFFVCSFLFVTGFAQGNSGLGFNYQAVVRGVDGFVLPKQSVELRFSLMPGQQATEASWVETHNVTTDDFGTVGVTVGKGTKAGGIAAQFKDVNFAAVHYWLKVEIQEGGNYRELSYTALASVPYAEAVTNAVSCPIGSIMPFAGDASKVPAGWLLCDGKAVSRSEYSTLYDLIGTSYGFGNNSTTFNLPDMRGMFLRGVSGDSGKDVDAATRVPLREGGNSGNSIGSYQVDAIRNIVGWITMDDQAFISGLGGAFYKGGASSYDAESRLSATTGVYTHFDANTGAPDNPMAGYANGADIRPQNVYVNYIIKY